MRIALHNKINFVTLVLVIIIAALPLSIALAQDSIIFETVQVDIWPEYDQPSVLIIYHITISSQTSLPAAINLRIPAEVGSPHAVAMQDPAGLYNLDYEMNAAGEWIEISFTTPVPDVRIEYYDPTLDVDSDQRNYIFRWPGNYQVGNFSLQVQEPPTATGMAFKPALGSGRQGNDGLTYFNYMVGQVDVGTPFELSLSYQKPDDQLTSSTQFQAVQPQEPVSVPANGGAAFDQILPWILAGLSLLLIITGGVWYWRTARAEQTVRARPRHSRKAVDTSMDRETAGAVYCHQCGKKAASGDSFCRSCGTKLR